MEQVSLFFIPKWGGGGRSATPASDGPVYEQGFEAKLTSLTERQLRWHKCNSFHVKKHTNTNIDLHIHEAEVEYLLLP